MDAADFPHVAVVSSNPLSSEVSNGIMMRSLFTGWPPDRLVQVYFPMLAGYGPQFDICQKYHIVHFSGHVTRRYRESHQDVHRLDPPVTNDNQHQQQRRRLLSRIKARPEILRWFKLGQECWYSLPWMERQLERELRRIRPEVVYALLGHYYLTKITARVCERLRIPLVLHVTDDFVTAAYEHLPLANRMQSASQYWFQRLFARRRAEPPSAPSWPANINDGMEKAGNGLRLW